MTNAVYLCGTPFTYSHRERLAIEFLRATAQGARPEVPIAELLNAIGVDDWKAICSVGLYMHFETEYLV
jgi:hypothetical protein